MTRRRWIGAVLVAIAGAAVTQGEPKEFTLARAIPDDVFICMSARYNPEREFLDEYWGEVIDAFFASGIPNDVFALISSHLDENQHAEFERIHARFGEICHNIDWQTIERGEFAFAERLDLFAPPGANVRTTFPNVVALVRCADTEANFRGLVAMLNAICEEINGLAGTDALTVTVDNEYQAEVHSVNLLEKVPGAPPITISIALREDVMLFSFGKPLLDEVLVRLDDESVGGRMVDDPRYVRAFERLPAAEDTIMFFDIKNMLDPMRKMFQSVSQRMQGPKDVTQNTGMTAAASKKNAEALSAYFGGDYDKALELVRAAHELEPRDSIVLYNLACFSALGGEKAEALDWLEKAVESGFYGPNKIAGDSDLDSLRSEPRYQAILARAVELAKLYSAKDIVLNSSKAGEAYKLTMQGWQTCERGEHEQALELAEQAQSLAPDDPRVLYLMSCAHARLGHDEQALKFLRSAVNAGFYCPQHITTDPDLEPLRKSDQFAAALSAARSAAAEHGGAKSASEEVVILSTMQRLIDAAAIVDCIAMVEYTDGYSTHQDSIALLIPDAAQHPLYKVFAAGGNVQGFDRFLPQETESFSVSAGFNLEAFYDFILETIGESGSAGEEMLMRWAGIQEEFGFNVQGDLLDWIGSEFTSMTLADGAGSVFLIEVKDEQLAREKAQAAVEMLSDGIAKLAEMQPMLQMLAMTTSDPMDERLSGFQTLQFMVAPNNPIVWGVSEGRLVIGSPEEAVVLCMQTAGGEHPSIRDNARAMAEMIVPSETCVAVSLTDQRKMGQQIAEVLAVIAPMAPMMAMAVPEPEARKVIMKLGGMVAKLGPVVRKIDFYKSTAMTTTFDGESWHTKSVTHFLAPEDRGVPLP